MSEPNKKEIEEIEPTDATSVEDNALSSTELDEVTGAGHNWGGG